MNYNTLTVLIGAAGCLPPLLFWIFRLRAKPTIRRDVDGDEYTTDSGPRIQK